MKVKPNQKQEAQEGMYLLLNLQLLSIVISDTRGSDTAVLVQSNFESTI